MFANEQPGATTLLQAEHPSGRVAKIEVTEPRRAMFGVLQQELKSRITGFLLGVKDRKKEVQLISKNFDFPEMLDMYLDNWQLLKQAGIPTVPTVRKISETEVVMTDMTANGGTFYGKARRNRNTHSPSELPQMDQIFLSINLKEVEVEAQRIAKLADEHGLILPSDDPFDLLVHPDGRWELIVLDFKNLEQANRNFQSLGDSNSQVIRFGMGVLGDLQYDLSQGRYTYLGSW